MIKVKTNVKAISVQVQNELKAKDKKIQSSMFRLAQMILRSARNTLNRSNKTSKPGASPISKSGGYSRSIRIRKVNNGYSVGPSGKPAKYARFLESGTRHMGARPMWRPMRKRFDRLAMTNIKKAIK